MSNRNRTNLGAETEFLEHKKSTGELKEGVISACAMLNKHGEGTVYFGTKNNGDVVGQEIGSDTLRDISRAFDAHITPVVYPTILEEIYGDAHVIKVTFKGGRKPYLAYKQPYIRVSDEDKQMEQDVYDDLLRERDDKSKAWESQISRYGVADIDMDVFARYLKRARKVGRITLEEDEPAVVLKKLELMEGDRLLNAGAALFVSSGMNDLQMAKFRTNERSGFADIDRKTGSILELVEVAMQYLIDAMDWRVEISGSIQRNEIPEVPVDALREAVVNAFAHRLIESGETVQIMVFRNRIEIYSPGAFPEKTTPEDFMSGKEKAIRRNKLIARTLYYSKDMESFATGLKNLKDLCNEAGVRFSFEKSVYGFTVVFYRHCGEGWGWTADDGENENDAKSEKNTEKTVYRPTSGEINGAINGVINGAINEDITISKNEKAILENIIENPRITKLELINKTGMGKGTIDRAMKGLKEKGVIQRIGSNKTGYWEVLRRE